MDMAGEQASSESQAKEMRLGPEFVLDELIAQADAYREAAYSLRDHVRHEPDGAPIRLRVAVGLLKLGTGQYQHWKSVSWLFSFATLADTLLWFEIMERVAALLRTEGLSGVRARLAELSEPTPTDA